jgi:hypothetical protein
MEDNVQTEQTNEVSERSSLGLRESLKQQLNTGDSDRELSQADKLEPVEPEVKEEATVEAAPTTPTPAPERPMLVPPSDMNQFERDAFLNPSAENAHVLQQYLNRRAYETRQQYDKKMQEVNQLQRETSSVYETIKKYEDDYAREGISISDVARRSIAWDRAMKANPVETAFEWLQAYGVSPEDLLQYGQTEQPQQQGEYLTREEAERIANERYQAMSQEQEKKALELYNQRVVELFMNGKPLFRDPETASQLEAEMAPVVQALNATGRYSSAEEVLETAYNYVVNGNPTFASIAQKMTTGPVVQQQQAVVQKAKQAAKSISGSAGSGTPRIHAQTLRDNLRRRFHGE